MSKHNIVTAGEKAAIYIGLFSLLFTAAFLGLADIISLVLLPALLAYSAIRLGYKHMIFESGLVILLYSLVSGGFAESAFLTVLPGAAIGVCMRRRRSLLYTVSAGAIAIATAEFLIYIIAAFGSGQQVHYAQSLTQDVSVMVEMLGLPAAESAMILQMIQMYMPSILLLSVAALSYAVVLVAQALLRRRAPEMVVMHPRFREMYVPKSALVVWGVASIVAFADTGVVGTTAANLAMILNCFIILCGFALIVFWISNTKSGFLKLMLYTGLVWMFSLASPVAFVLGLVDAVFHFRSRKRGDEQ